MSLDYGCSRILEGSKSVHEKVYLNQGESLYGHVSQYTQQGLLQNERQMDWDEMVLGTILLINLIDQ